MSEQAHSSKSRAAVLIKAALQALDAAGGSLSLGDLQAEVARRVDLTDYDRHVYEKSGHVRWKSILHFHSIGCVKAGFMKKTRGTWWITPEGREVMNLPGEEIIERGAAHYKVWLAERRADKRERSHAKDSSRAKPFDTEEEEEEVDDRSFVLDTAQSQARNEIIEYLGEVGPYDFQELVAALLRAMGYATPFIAPKGPDGGTDILAYRDPLGTETPHVRVQVKHRQDKASRAEVAALRGIIRPDREIGLFVSSGGFTPAAEQEARNGSVHIQLMNLGEFLDLWIGYYDKMSEEDRGRLRLTPVYFLSPD